MGDQISPLMLSAKETAATTGDDEMPSKAQDLGRELEDLFHRADCIHEELCSVLERARVICDELAEAER
jgi:hypothetical protein